MTVIGYNYIRRTLDHRKQGFGPFYHIEQYARRWYDVFGDLMSKITIVIFCVVFFGSILIMVVMGAKALWDYGQRLQHPQPAPAPASDFSYVPAADPCSLTDVVCPGEKETVVGTASWLVYQLPDTCAARAWARGTTLIVMNNANGKATVCVQRDHGPDVTVFPDRIVDLSSVSFSKVSDLTLGLFDATVYPCNEETAKLCKNEPGEGGIRWQGK
jgi:hypothetical protein